MKPQALTLPYPPSANRYWRVDRGTVHTSAAARLYKSEAAALAVKAGLEKAEGPVKVTLVAYRPARRGDLDNTQKIILDSMQGIAYENDSQIVELHAYRREDKAAPRVEITIEEMR